MYVFLVSTGMPDLTQIKPVLPSSHTDMMLSFALHLTQAQPFMQYMITI
jgi:hypothetical protein